MKHFLKRIIRVPISTIQSEFSSSVVKKEVKINCKKPKVFAISIKEAI